MTEVQRPLLALCLPTLAAVAHFKPWHTFFSHILVQLAQLSWTGDAQQKNRGESNARNKDFCYEKLARLSYAPKRGFAAILVAPYSFKAAAACLQWILTALVA